MGIRIEKSYYFFGSPIVIYPCPNCGHELKSPVADIGNEDTCSECDQLFEVPGDVEYQIYVDARKPKVIQKPKKPRKSRIQLHLEHLELQTNDIARLDMLKAKALKEGRMCDYANSIFNQENSYWQIAEKYRGDEEPELRSKIINANYLESTKKCIEYEYLLSNGAWNVIDNSDSVWDKDMSDSHEPHVKLVLQPYSRMKGDLFQLEGLFIEVATKMQKSLKSPISPQVAWKRFAKSMKCEKDFIRQNFFTE